MPLALDIDEIVERLESAWMSRLEEFGRSLMLSNGRVVAQTFSHRHADVVHNLGLSCHPVGSDSLDPKSVALIVTVITMNRPSVKGYVVWQAAAVHREGETATCRNLEGADVARFIDELQGLLSVLAAAVERGAPSSESAGAAEPGPNQPL